MTPFDFLRLLEDLKYTTLRVKKKLAIVESSYLLITFVLSIKTLKTVTNLDDSLMTLGRLLGTLMTPFDYIGLLEGLKYTTLLLKKKKLAIGESS